MTGHVIQRMPFSERKHVSSEKGIFNDLTQNTCESGDECSAHNLKIIHTNDPMSVS